MIFSSHARRVADYLAATGNEIAVDRHFISLAGYLPSETGYLPRSPKWIGRAQRHRAWLRWTWRAAWLAWVCGGAAAFFLLQMLVRWRGAPSPAAVAATLSAIGDRGAVLALSSRVGDIVTNAQFPDFPRTWISFPWAPLRATPANVTQVDVFSLLSKADLWRALRDALYATSILARRSATRPWVLQSYTAFRWFAVRAALEKTPQQLVTAEHFDRWAIVADTVATHFRRGGHRGELALVQHGSLAKLDAEASQRLQLARRLRSVTDLYAYSDEALLAFKADILSHQCAARLRSSTLFSPGIILQGEANSALPRLLFVGAPMCESFHKRVFEALRKECDFIAYYKPHPMAPMSEAMRHVGWELVGEPRHFPVVELLVSYESTLVLEYQGLGIAAAVHPINIGDGPSDSLVAQVSSILRAHGKKQ